MKQAVSSTLIASLIVVIITGSGTTVTTAFNYKWEKVRQAGFNELDIESIGPLEINGTHLLTFDSTTMQLLVIDMELTEVLANHTIVHVRNASNQWDRSYPLIYGLTLAKGYLFAVSSPQKSVYLLDSVNYTVLEAYETVSYITDMTYDETTDCFAVTLIENQTIAVYNGSYFNGSLTSMEFSSLDTPSLIGSWDYPEPMPVSIAACKGEYFTVTLTGTYTHFTTGSEGLEFIYGAWERLPVETYSGYYTQDACFINYSCVYFTSPLSHKIVLFRGMEIEETVTTTMITTRSTGTTDSSTEFSVTTSSSSEETNPFVNSTGSFGGITVILAVAAVAAITRNGKNR